MRFFVLLFLVAGIVAVRAEAQVASHPSPAFAADDFLDSVGINGSPIVTRIYEDGPFKGAGTKPDPQIFYDLGIRNYREVLKYDLTLADQPQQVLDAWKKSGARAMLFLDNNHVKDPLEQLAILKRYDPRAVVEVEGPNEPNNKFPPQDLNIKYKGQTDEAAAAAYMTDFYAAIKADPIWKQTPVVGFSAIFTDYNLAKGFTGFDEGNIHSYQGYGVPSSSLEMNITRWNNILPPRSVIKPFVPTETGYNVDKDIANGTFKTGSYRAQALNIPMLLAEYFRHGIKRTYLFAIHNADGYGLLEGDNKTKRPSYFAVKNFLDQIREAKWNPTTLRWEGAKPFTPRSLNFALENAPDTVHTLTLQKSSGDYSLLLWNEVQNFDQNQTKDLFPAPVPVTIRFAAPVGTTATLLVQNDKGAYDSQTLTVKNGALELSVPSSVAILRIKSGALPRTPAPTSVTNLGGTATSWQADLEWQQSPLATGYFVFRNGWHIGTSAETAFSDKSSWLRPGLGYTYEIQPFDRFGQTAPHAQTVVFTPDGRPDLIVTRVWSESNEVGKPAGLRANIKNVGDGPTPFDTGSSVTFHVNGQYTSFGGTGALQPGQEATISPDGGNLNWSPDKNGSYSIRAQADDINRVPGEKSESNNSSEWTLAVGQNADAKLLVEGSEGTFSANLSEEGALDWVAFGLAGGEGVQTRTDVNRKANANLISKVSEFGAGFLASTVGSSVRLRWQDGAPTAQSDGTNAGMWWNGAGHGVEFSVPASAQERTLKLYVSGLNGARGKLEAQLSDGSAPAVTSTLFDGNRGNGNWAPIPDSFSGQYTVRFATKTPGATLKIRWSMDNEPNQWSGQVRLQAITLR